MSLYDKYILPRMLNCACSSKPMVYQRQKIVPLAEGDVLEVGIGSGLNLPFYDKSKVNKIWGLDPSKELNRMASKVAAEENLEARYCLSHPGSRRARTASGRSSSPPCEGAWRLRAE